MSKASCLTTDMSYSTASNESSTMRPIYPSCTLECCSNPSFSLYVSAALRLRSFSSSSEKYRCCMPVPFMGTYPEAVFTRLLMRLSGSLPLIVL